VFTPTHDVKDSCVCCAKGPVLLRALGTCSVSSARQWFGDAFSFTKTITALLQILQALAEAAARDADDDWVRVMGAAADGCDGRLHLEPVLERFALVRQSCFEPCLISQHLLQNNPVASPGCKPCTRREPKSASGIWYHHGCNVLLLG